MSHKCCDCSTELQRREPARRWPKRCSPCQLVHRKNSERLRKANAPRHTYTKQCINCRKQFVCGHRNQKTCGIKCRGHMSQTRFLMVCANATCGKEFELTPSRYAIGSRCCSRKCRSEHMKSPRQLCQNPACGCVITRASAGPMTKKRGKDYFKYCSPSCYLDHRWGKDRPRKPSSKKACASASVGALQTSLRKKCKELGRPYDPECNRVAVCERDGWVCQMCGIDCLKQWTFDKVARKIDGRSAEHDHIIALATPGSPGNVFPNSQCLCHACNFKKRTAARGQLRLDLEGSVQRWVDGGLARSQRRLRCSAETLAAGL
jgi:hypothetical protein